MPKSKTSTRAAPHISTRAHIPTRAIGFMLAHEQFTIPQLIDFGVAAEAAQFDLLATSDHLQPWQDNQGHSGSAWVTLTALALKTRSVWLGPTVTCPTFRYNPAVVAEVFASLSALAPGRIYLGIGSGEALNEQAATGEWPDWEERSERLIEATGLIQKLWTGNDIYHDGKFFAVDGKLYDPPAAPIPILMAANGPKAMERAGRLGVGLVTEAKTWQEHKDKYVAGLAQADKQLGDVPVLIEHYVVVGDAAEVQRAAELWRFGPKAFKGYHSIVDPQRIREKADAEISLQEVTEGWVTGFDPKRHLQAIEDVFASGATIVNVHSGQADQHALINFYGKEVIPLLKQNSN